MRFLWSVDLAADSDRGRFAHVADTCARLRLDPVFLWHELDPATARLFERRAELDTSTVIALHWHASDAQAKSIGYDEHDLEQALTHILERERPAFVIAATTEDVGGQQSATSERAAQKAFGRALLAAADQLAIPRLAVDSAAVLAAWRDEASVLGATATTDLQAWLEACLRAIPEAPPPSLDVGEPTVPLEQASFGALQRRVAAVLARLLRTHAQAEPGPFSLALGTALLQQAQDQMRAALRQASSQASQASQLRQELADQRELGGQADLLCETLAAERGWLRNAVRFLEGERDILRGRADMLIAELAVERNNHKRARGHTGELWRALTALQQQQLHVLEEARELAKAVGMPMPEDLDPFADRGLAAGALESLPAQLPPPAEET